MAFELDHLYSRQDISDILGGSQQSYLPTVDGRVVSGCFVPRINPNAPAEVLFGNEDDSPDINKTANQVFAQGSQNDAIHVFLKRGSSQ